MPINKFPEDQKYSLVKKINFRDNLSPAGEKASAYYVVEVGRPKLISVQVRTRNNTNIDISLGGNIYGIDPDNPNADNDNDFIHANHSKNFFSIETKRLITNNGTTTLTTDIPCTHIGLALVAGANNKVMNFIVYITTYY